ncbi:MAG TPA: DivIVA domain-containing protein [Actinomycetota bacterium]
MGKRDKTTTDGSFQATPPPTASAPTRVVLGPLEIQAKEFRVSRFGGYKMRDVDEFLDSVTDSMSALVAENDRLRKGAPAPVVGAPDLDDVSRQADEIIERARTEAARIVAGAKAQASGTASTPQDRAAVNAFLAKEREFLQSLAGLVQGHAESVKGMSKAVRKPAAPAQTAPSAASPAPVSSTSTEAASDATAVQEAAEAAPATSIPEAAVSVVEPEPAAVARSDDDGSAEGDRSLRDLFWGED